MTTFAKWHVKVEGGYNGHGVIGIHANWMIAARRNQGERRHNPLCDAPVIVAILGISPRTDVETARTLNDFKDRPQIAEVVSVAFCSLEQRISLEIAAMQPRDVA